jgi:replicative DNA helicase Mcm
LDNVEKHQHIDIQSQGTYVIGPGSIHPDTKKKYEIISSTTHILKMGNFSGFLQGLKSMGFNTDGTGLKPFQEIAKGKVSTGNRNSSAFKYACNLLDNVRMNAETTWIELKRWNSVIDAPLTERELKTVYESAIKKTNPHVEKEPETNIRLLREITAKDEGKEITFNAFICALDDHKTVTTEATMVCSNEHQQVTVQQKGNGYENISSMRCPKCSHYMALTHQKTNDVRVVVLQELQDEVKDNNIFRKEAKLIGCDALDAYISTKQIQFTGKLKSVPIKGKKENSIILFIKEMVSIEDRRDEIPTDIELAEINENENIMDVLSQSFAPDILGYNEIKKTILLHLVEGGNMRRDQIHLLLIGNPSKAKSELLKATNQLVESSYVNGKMASGAGMAYGMVKLPNGTSVAQVGPLGLSRFIQIDELDKMRIEDRGSLLEVMEQQSISLTKAGIHSSIPAKPSILSAANPKFSTWDVELDILKNINFESFLLTRFDLIIGLITEDPVNDGFVYDHIINNAIGIQKSPVDKTLLIKYLNLCRTKKPKLTKDAGRKISDFFKNIKNEIQINNDSYVPIETRQLEGMVRLSTAHAKILLKDEVDIEDVDEVIKLFKYSLDSLHIGYEGSPYQSDLNEKKLSREQAFLIILKEMRDDDGYLNETSVVQRMAKDKRFGDIDKARKYFDFAVHKQMIHLSRDGTSYVEPTPISPH